MVDGGGPGAGPLPLNMALNRRIKQGRRMTILNGVDMLENDHKALRKASNAACREKGGVSVEKYLDQLCSLRQMIGRDFISYFFVQQQNWMKIHFNSIRRMIMIFQNSFEKSCFHTRLEEILYHNSFEL